MSGLVYMIYTIQIRIAGALGQLSLIYLCINVDTEDQASPEDIFDRLLPDPIRIQLVTAMPTLHYLTIGGGEYWDDLEFADFSHHYQYWRVIRSTEAGVQPRLELLSRDNGVAVRERIVAMDREALLNFDINAFSA